MSPIVEDRGGSDGVDTATVDTAMVDTAEVDAAPVDAVPADAAGVNAAPVDAADVRVPPLLIYALFMAAAFGLDQLLPLRFPTGPVLRNGGFVLIAAGLVLIVWTILTFVIARVVPLPFMPPGRLILVGPLAMSRNPIYLGGMIAYVGTALVGGWIWLLITAVPLVAVVQRWIIGREERFLAMKFGDEYRAYAARVRRWI